MAGTRRPGLWGYGGAVAALHLAGWGLLLRAASAGRPSWLGLGALAYSFGLRHAFDADHIAAIDNATRRLMQEERVPDGAGFYFSLGHSTVVAAMAVGVALGARSVSIRLPALQHLGAYVGTAVSGAFLYAMALANLGALGEARRAFRAAVRRNAPVAEGAPGRGLFHRLLGRFPALVRRPAQMYPVGLLFGLGFDTASEVALLAMAAVAASRRVPLWAVCTLPVLFAAGMSLFDTADGAFMARAYGWALARPVRRAYYNLTVTSLSVLVAAGVGSVEWAQVAASEAHLGGAVGRLLRGVNFERMGYGVVGLFLLTWLVALALWKFGRIEARAGGLPEADG